MASEETGKLDFGDDVDEATFEQILEMDDPDDAREFSSSIVFGFFDQAEQTFTSMNEAMAKKDLAELSRLGHFLKGSSATLGFNKVRDQCEKIQNYGQYKDEVGNQLSKDEIDDTTLLKKIGDCLERAQDHYRVVEMIMRKYYGQENTDH